MSLNGLISIIIPIFNVEEHLEECISSLIVQTYHNLEIILVDDESTDSSGQMCDELSNRDSRIKVIHKMNEGVSEARNAAIEIAQGEYIGFVDGDDFCEQNMFQKLLDALTINDADICICSFNRYDGQHKIKAAEPLRPGCYNKTQIKDEIILPMVGSSSAAPQCAPVMGSLWRCLFKREIIEKDEKLRLKKIKMAEDLVFDIEYLCRCEKTVVIEDALYNYRESTESSSRRYITDLMENIVLLHQYLREVLERNDVFDKRMHEYYQMTELYNYTWCISNACKVTNPSSNTEIIGYLRNIRNNADYKKVLKWKYIKGISWKERIYFILIKLHLYGLVLWFNRRKE